MLVFIWTCWGFIIETLEDLTGGNRPLPISREGRTAERANREAIIAPGSGRHTATAEVWTLYGADLI